MTLRSSLAGRSPVVPQLRPYQTAIVGGTHASLQTHQRSLVVSPTATGKTVCMLELAKLTIAAGGRVLIVVPASLVKQTADRAREWGLRTDTEKGSHYAETWVDCIVASIDTLTSGERLKRWDEENFQLVLVDEAHHTMAATWRRVLDHFSMAKVVGFTATPDRHDCKDLMDVYQDVAFEYTIQEAIADHWLTPINQKFCRVQGLDFTRVRSEARDLHSGDLDALYNNAEIIKLMATATVEAMVGRKSIVFCTSVDLAYGFAEYLRKLGCSAGTIVGTTKQHEREALETDFIAGRIQYLTNVDCLSEGWDCPPVSGIVQARSTESRALYAQQIGRGLRLFPGKADCLVLDFVGNSGEHCLVHTAHVIDPNLDDRQGQRATDLMLEDPDLKVTDAIQLALEQIADEDTRMRLEEELRRAAAVDAKFELINVDPFDSSDTRKVFDLLHIPRTEDRWDRDVAPVQIELLQRFGVKDPDVLNGFEATNLIEKLSRRQREGRATLRQARKLIQAGTNPTNALALSYARAKAGLDELKANGWRRPRSWGPRAKEPHPDAVVREDLLERLASDS